MSKEKNTRKERSQRKQEKRWARADAFFRTQDGRGMRGFYARAVKILLLEKFWDAIMPLNGSDNFEYMLSQFNMQNAERIRSLLSEIERELVMPIRHIGKKRLRKKSISKFTGEMMKKIKRFIPPNQEKGRAKDMSSFSKLLNKTFCL